MPATQVDANGRFQGRMCGPVSGNVLLRMAGTAKIVTAHGLRGCCMLPTLWPSFALDLMEELHSPLCDRLTLSLFNKGQLEKGDFQRASGGIYPNTKRRKTFLSAWRARCQEEIRHPFLRGGSCPSA